MSKAWNKFGLTWLQFQFCIEYLKNGHNADAAYMKAYNTTLRNSDSCMRSKNVQKYLRHRMKIALEAAEVDYNYLIKVLALQLSDASPQVRANASATLERALQHKDLIEVKLKELELKQEQLKADKEASTKPQEEKHIVINIGEAKKQDGDY